MDSNFLSTELYSETKRTLYHRFQGRYRARATYIFLFFVSGYLIIPPLIMMIWMSIHHTDVNGLNSSLTLSSYSQIFSDSKFWNRVSNTLVYALSSTVCTTLIGSVMAWLVGRTDCAGKWLAYATTFVGFSIPTMIEIIGWVLLLGSNGKLNQIFHLHINIQSMWGMVFVETLLWTPMVFLLMMGPFQSLDKSLEEAALISGANTVMAYIKVTLPLLWPAILSVIILMFIETIQSFEVPLFLGTVTGYNTLTSAIYMDLKESMIPDYSRASAYGVVLILFLSMGLMLYQKVTSHSNRYQTVTGKGFKPRIHHLGLWRWVGGLFLLVIFLLTLCPILYMVYASLLPTLGVSFMESLHKLTLLNYMQLFADPDFWRSVFNTLFVSICSASICVILSLLASWIIVRTKLKGRAFLEQLLGFPLIFPGIVLGLAILILYLNVPYISLYGTIWILVVAYVTHFIPYSMRYSQPALLQIHPDLEQMANVSGASSVAIFRKILGPLIMPSLVGGWIFIFFHVIRELSIAALLYTT